MSGLHCVTTWSWVTNFTGVRLSAVLALAEPLSQPVTSCATHMTATRPTSLVEALKDDVLLVHTWDGAAAQRAWWPVRVTPQLYVKGAKWVNRNSDDRGSPGLLEQRGYSNTAYPGGMIDIPQTNLQGVTESLAAAAEDATPRMTMTSI